MQCARCREELPESTPVCPACGPIVIGAGFGSALPVAAASGLAMASPEAVVVESRADVRARAQAQREKQRRDKQQRQQQRNDRGARPSRSTPPPLEDAVAVRDRPVPKPVRILAVADLIAGFALLFTAFGIVNAAGGITEGILFPAGRSVLLGGAMVAAAGGLFLLKPIGRTLQIGVAGFSILVHGSTLAGLLTLAYLLRPLMMRFFEGGEVERGPEPWSGTDGQLWVVLAGVAALFQVVWALGGLAQTGFFS
jgi:hypothetical protein